MIIDYLLRKLPLWRSEHQVHCIIMFVTRVDGLQDMQTPELKVAIKSAQRLAERMIAGGGAQGGLPARHPPSAFAPDQAPAAAM